MLTRPDQPRGHVLWQGFDFSWRRAPHRLNHLSSFVEGHFVPDRDSFECSHQAGLSVGRVPDSARMRAHVTTFRCADLWAVHGMCTTRLEAELGQVAEVRGERLHIPIPDGLDGPWTGAAVLQGVELNCESALAGYHNQGFGFALTDPRTDESGLSFQPLFSVQANNSPDRLTSRKGHYTYNARLWFTALFGREDRVHFSQDLDDAPTGHERHTATTVPPVAPIARLQGRCAPEFNRAVLGVRGLSWTQHHTSPSGRNGRFIRQFHAWLDNPDYEVEGGWIRFSPRLWLDNHGLANHPLDAEHSLWTTLIQYRDDDRAPQPSTLEAKIPTGIGQGSSRTERHELS